MSNSLQSPEPDGIEREALQYDAALLRSTRWRLVAWSGGITLIVLMILGGTFYAVVSRLLEDASVARLEARVAQVVPSRPTDLDDMPPLERVMGGTTAGTFAYVIGADGHVFRPSSGGPENLPDADSIDSALADGRDLRTTMVDDVPFRVLSLPAAGSVLSPSRGRVSVAAIQVVEDRVAEQEALSLMLDAMVLGGAAAIILAVLAGAFYSGRALVPIRDSLAAQRRALRRQRDFAADASHELRTPLTIIRTSVEDLRLHADQPVRSVGRALTDIEAEVTQITGLVDDLLLLARSESGALDLAFEPVELGDLAATVAAAMSGLARERDVAVAIDPEPVMVAGDRKRLRQLVTILADNGVRHSPPASVLIIRVRARDDVAELTVDDPGTGIPADDLPHVFDRFWRGRQPGRRGTGLGLAIAQSIVLRHGGDIAASNRPEGGARFTVRLPKQPPGPEPAPVGARSDATSSPEGDERH